MQKNNVEQLLQQAKEVLKNEVDTQISQLHSPEVIKDWERNFVIRCKVEGSTKNKISSIIIKQIKNNKTCGYSDWAGLYFLSQLQNNDNIAPHFYGGDVNNSFFIIEDLGPSKTIEDVMNGRDSDLNERCFIDLAKNTAKLHKTTVNKECEYQQLRGSYPHDNDYGRNFESNRWNEGMKRVYQWFSGLDWTVPNGFEGCLNDITDLYLNPGTFLSFTHGDMAPSNNHVVDDQVRLLDFEYGGFRHALYDMTCWYMLCPLPEWFVQKIIYHYKSELGSEIYLSDEIFERNWRYICAWRGLAMLTWIPPTILEKNRPWVGEWTMREAVLSTLDRLYKVSSELNELRPIAEGASILYRELTSRWNEYQDLLPKWPVFQDK